MLHLRWEVHPGNCDDAQSNRFVYILLPSDPILREIALYGLLGVLFLKIFIAVFQMIMGS